MIVTFIISVVFLVPSNIMLSHVFGWFCTVIGFAMGLCGLLAFGCCGSIGFRWSYIVAGCVLWLLAAGLAVHGAMLVLDLSSVSVPELQNYRSVATPLLRPSLSRLRGVRDFNRLADTKGTGAS